MKVLILVLGKEKKERKEERKEERKKGRKKEKERKKKPKGVTGYPSEYAILWFSLYPSEIPRNSGVGNLFGKSSQEVGVEGWEENFIQGHSC